MAYVVVAARAMVAWPMTPRPAVMPTEAIERALSEFGLGELLNVRALDGGISVPFYVATDHGEFVLHAEADAREAALYRDVARRLKAAGLRRASLRSRRPMDGS